MKVSREQSAKHRDHILEVATKLFREQGFEGIGVAELMHAAGFTHGGFYGHFSSKESLIDESCVRAFREKEAIWTDELSHCDGRPLNAMANRYLSKRHCADRATGCPLASWAVDVSRLPIAIRHTFTEGLRKLVAILAGKLDGRMAKDRQEKSLATWSTLVGAIVLARAVDDPAMAKSILQAAAKSLTEPGSR